MGLAPGSATANSFWTRARDKRLAVEWSKGRSAAEIAKTIGVTRNAVIGRSMRLRGSVHPSDIASWTRANAQRSAALRKRAQSQRQAIQDMAKAMARGTPRGKAVSRAQRAGATFARIARQLGIAPQTAHYRAKIWTEQARPVRAFHR